MVAVRGMLRGRMRLRRLITHFAGGYRRRICTAGDVALRRIHIIGVAGMEMSGTTPTGIRTMDLRL